MPGSFLDTTILVDASTKDSPRRPKAEAFILNNQPSHIAIYAFRELLTGPVRYICDAHNSVLAANDPAEAIASISDLPPFKRRASDMAVKEIAKTIMQFFSLGGGSSVDAKRESLQALKIKAAQLWNRGNPPHAVKKVLPLACFNEGSVGVGPAGELVGPNQSFNCKVKERCAAAAWIYNDQATLSILIAALHPSKLDPAMASKHETSRRRKVLKELKRIGPIPFRKSDCRALGDAYFAAICPPDQIMTTTNLGDFIPLCTALKKALQSP